MEFLAAIRQIIREELINAASQDDKEKFLSMDEARKLFQPVISRGTLYNWMNADYIESYMIGGKRCFKYSELIEAAKKLKKHQQKEVIEDN